MAELQYAFISIKPAEADVGCHSCNLKQYRTAVRIKSCVTENSTLDYIKKRHMEMSRQGIKPYLSLEEELLSQFG